MNHKNLDQYLSAHQSPLAIPGSLMIQALDDLLELGDEEIELISATATRKSFASTAEG